MVKGAILLVNKLPDEVSIEIVRSAFSAFGEVKWVDINKSEAQVSLCSIACTFCNSYLVCLTSLLYWNILQVRLVASGKRLGIINAGVFTGRMPFLLPNQQHQSTEWIEVPYLFDIINFWNFAVDMYTDVVVSKQKWRVSNTPGDDDCEYESHGFE